MGVPSWTSPGGFLSKHTSAFLSNMNDRSCSVLLVLRNNNGPQGSTSHWLSIKTQQSLYCSWPAETPLPPHVFLKSPWGYTASVNSSTHSLFLSLLRFRASITHTAIRMQVSGSRIKLWCPLISLALIQFFTPVSAQGNCCLHGSELAVCSGASAFVSMCKIWDVVLIIRCIIYLKANGYIWLWFEQKETLTLHAPSHLLRGLISV